MADEMAQAGPETSFVSPDGAFALYAGDCLEIMPRLDEASVDLIFADPPYFLSNGGITCQSGRMAAVDKGGWDKSRGFAGDHRFTLAWLGQCQRLLKPHGSIWVSGTSHIIHQVGAAMQELGFKLLNDITWVKTNPPPNLSCRYFTHATETIIWAAKNPKTKHKFNYQDMKAMNGGKQMTSVWHIEAPRKQEKLFGKHPTQKPLALMNRILLAASDPGDLVLDPFCGSGTTGLAAAALGRRFMGVEKDSAYVELCLKRFQAQEPPAALASSPL